MKINSITTLSPLFPERLRTIPHVPKNLYFRGDLPAADRTGVAIVGTRKPTRYGQEVTFQLANRLAERGIVIVSGLALGVDAVAHRGALAARGSTIAVLAGGVDKPTPFTNSNLADEILAAGGALISEYPAGTPPLTHQFLERNRLVAGLADTIIVTEASLRSGTSNTVSHALEQGKDVYAVPGPITSPMSAGCNHMIAQGAVPVTSVDELVEHLAPRAGQTSAGYAYDPTEKIIIDLIQSGIREGDELHAKSRLDAGLFATTMTMLELRGAIRPLGANQWSL